MAADPATSALGNSATCAARRVPTLLSHRRNPKGGCGHVLWTTRRLERCRTARPRPDVYQSHRPARGRWMLAELDQLRHTRTKGNDFEPEFNSRTCRTYHARF